VRRLKGLSRASAAFGGAQSAPLTDLSASAFRSLFQTMATRGVGVRFQGASAVQIALEPRGRRTTVDVAGLRLIGGGRRNTRQRGSLAQPRHGHYPP
jgi:hypothetical protein